MAQHVADPTTPSPPGCADRTQECSTQGSILGPADYNRFREAGRIGAIEQAAAGKTDCASGDERDGLQCLPHPDYPPAKSLEVGRRYSACMEPQSSGTRAEPPVRQHTYRLTSRQCMGHHYPCY